jgi:hypothetical protein
VLVSVALAANEYARAMIYNSSAYAFVIVHGTYERPYVYRALMPWLAQGLVALGFREDIALSMVVVCSAIGLVYAIQYFLSSFRRR